MYFSVRTGQNSFTQQACESPTAPDAKYWSATHRRFPQIASLIIHTARLSLAGTSTDLPPISGICRRFIKTCRRVKNRAKIVQCELGISFDTEPQPCLKKEIPLPTLLVLCSNHCSIIENWIAHDIIKSEATALPYWYSH